jgi:O-antigen/teichoic acid export membrane protein
MAFQGRRYLRSLGSGYLVMGIQILYGLAVIPLVLNHLGKETFGVWALALQVSSWLLMIDAGMTAGASRFFIDHQDEPESRECAACISTTFRLLCAQGLLVFGGALALGGLVPWVAALNQADSAGFFRLMLVLGIAAAIGFIAKINSSWLYATQRLEWVNWLALVAVVAEWLALIWMLNRGWGLISLAYAKVLNTIITGAGGWFVASRFGGFPWRRIFGPWNPEVFKQLAKFGTGILAFTIAAQVLNASQTFLVAKFLGVGSAAVWATAPKLFLTVQLVVARISDFALPGLLLLVHRGSMESARCTFVGTLKTTAQLAAIGGGIAAILNPGFLIAWTAGRIEWSHLSDILMACLILVFLVTKTFTDVVVHSKKLGALPWVFALESIAFLSSVCLLLPRFGIPGMLFASIVTSILIRLPYVVWRIDAYLGFNRVHRWALLRGVALAIIAAGIAALLTHSILNASGRADWWLLAAAGAAGCVPAVPVLWRLFRTHATSSLT